jgi:hypothetical protein
LRACVGLRERAQGQCWTCHCAVSAHRIKTAETGWTGDAGQEAITEHSAMSTHRWTRRGSKCRHEAQRRRYEWLASRMGAASKLDTLPSAKVCRVAANNPLSSSSCSPRCQVEAGTFSICPTCLCATAAIAFKQPDRHLLSLPFILSHSLPPECLSPLTLTHIMASRAIPSHLKPSAAEEGGFAPRHHGKSQSHVVSWPLILSLRPNIARVCSHVHVRACGLTAIAI